MSVEYCARAPKCVTANITVSYDEQRFKKKTTLRVMLKYKAIHYTITNKRHATTNRHQC
jgi:hypothetical protein